jgi:hypothetical protein
MPGLPQPKLEINAGDVVQRDRAHIVVLADRFEVVILKIHCWPVGSQRKATSGIAYFKKGMSDQAVAAELQEASRRGLSAGLVATLEQTYASRGLNAYRAKSRALVLQGNEPEKYRLAVLDAELGDQAFGCLEKLYRRAPNWITWIKVDPSLDALHSDARYSLLLQRMGLMP